MKHTKAQEHAHGAADLREQLEQMHFGHLGYGRVLREWIVDFYGYQIFAHILKSKIGAVVRVGKKLYEISVVLQKIVKTLTGKHQVCR